MGDLGLPRFRRARAADATAIAALHAESWRRHYRGAYSDAFLDGDLDTDRGTHWDDRLHAVSNREHTHLAEQDGVVIGFVHTILHEDPMWGALLANLHVSHGHQRRGIGAQLLRLSAKTVAYHAAGSGLYVWVLAQNRAAQAFYQAMGGRFVERDEVAAPGDIAARLSGSPTRLRYAWPEPVELIRTWNPVRPASGQLPAAARQSEPPDASRW